MESIWPVDNTPSGPPLELRKGVELNQRYVIAEMCGSGGFATVWRATDKVESRDVAIKRLLRNSTGSADIHALLAEAEKVKKLKGHKNIVQLYETFTEGDEGFIVMEYVNGETLNDLLKQHVKSSTWIEQDEALDYIKQIFEGLIYAHSSGLYHCDIKPSNILISTVGTVKLVDFGLARAMTEEARQSPGGLAWTGTPQYMSYEQASGEALNHQTDIMSVGIVAYMLITGRHPFNHPSGILTEKELIADQNYPCPKATAWDGKPLKPFIAEVLHRMLQKDRATRYQNLVEPLGVLSKDDSIQCPKCTAANPKGNRFCGQCGNSLVIIRAPEHALAGPRATELTAEELTAQGFECTRSNDWDKAIDLYRTALEKDPKYAAAHANLGFALNRKAEYTEAIEVANQGLKLANDDGIRHRLYDVLGFAKSSLNDPQGAIADFSAALRLRDNPRVLVHRAESKAALNDIPGAYDDVLAALEIDTDYYAATRLRDRLDKLM